MAGVNKVILVGKLGADPEMRYTAGGTAVCKFSLATNRRFTGKDGQKQDKTEWHRIVAWAKLAEICGQYLAKGKEVYIEGRIQTRSWDDKTSGQKKYMTEIVANDLVLLGGGRGEAGEGGGGRGRAAAAPATEEPHAPAEHPAQSAEITDEDIPF